ncbi:MAG: hypothetical protein RMJ48_16275 [Roseiflexaceae bacterium]|nr:hypothetical protein [Roseiflexus sp.]MDW8147833.1 hypothetical protein [Roseiflexaceae bacterium]
MLPPTSVRSGRLHREIGFAALEVTSGAPLPGAAPAPHWFNVRLI